MKLHQFIVDVGRASRVIDATGRTSPLIIDVPVRVGQPDTADEDEAVVVAPASALIKRLLAPNYCGRSRTGE